MNKSNQHIQFAFFGTSVFAVAILEELKDNNFFPSLVITTKDKPAGRGMRLTLSPVKVWAEKNNIEIIQPDNLDENFAQLMKRKNYPIFVVASYGKIIPSKILEIPEHKTLNVHPSLLPHHRGPSPIQGQILSDNPDDIGVSIMVLDDEMDHGPLLAQTQITPQHWPLGALELESVLAHEGGKLLSYVLPEWFSGKITPEPQNHEDATYTKLIDKKDAQIDLKNTNDRENYLKILAYDKNPRSYFFTKNGKRVLITQASFDGGKLTIKKVIPEGKKEMDYKNFLRDR